MRGSAAKVEALGLRAGLTATLADLGAALEALERATLSHEARMHLDRARAAAAQMAHLLDMAAAHLAGPADPAADRPGAGPCQAGGPRAGDADPDAAVTDAAGTDAADTGEPDAFDRERYLRLIEIAGHEGARELLARLHTDLGQVERGLVRALAEPGAAEIRAHTHVLVALAGAVGATGLQHLAEALNAAAHREAANDIDRLGARTLEQLARLRAFIAAEQATGRSPA